MLYYYYYYTSLLRFTYTHHKIHHTTQYQFNKDTKTTKVHPNSKINDYTQGIYTALVAATHRGLGDRDTYKSEESQNNLGLTPQKCQFNKDTKKDMYTCV